VGGPSIAAAHEGQIKSGRDAARPAQLLPLPMTNRLTVPAVKLSTIGSRAFSVPGPQTWNQLPEEITSAIAEVISSGSWFHV